MTFKLGALSQGSPSVIVLQCKTQHASVLSIFLLQLCICTKI